MKLPPPPLPWHNLIISPLFSLQTHETNINNAFTSVLTKYMQQSGNYLKFSVAKKYNMNFIRKRMQKLLAAHTRSLLLNVKHTQTVLSI